MHCGTSLRGPCLYGGGCRRTGGTLHPSFRIPLEGRRMKISRKLFVVAAVTVAMLAIAGCPTGTTVNKIQQDPGRFYNKEVALRGTVTEPYGALGTGVYQLE